MRYQVVITDCPWQDISVEREVLAQVGISLSKSDCRNPEEVTEACRDADALLVGWAPINRQVIESLTRCRIIVRYGTGYDNVDVAAATSAGIAVANNPDYCVEEVATHSLAMLLACHRQLFPLTRDVAEGIWDPTRSMARMPRLSEQTLGIVGYGRIGRKLAEMATGLLKNVLIYDPQLHEAGKGITLEHLLANSDYISVHAPLTDDTHHLFNAERLARMKQSAYLINCSRGQLVDTEALVRALEANMLGGAALDVFEAEPLPAGHPLRNMRNVVLTPHAAWYSTGAEHDLRANPAKKVRDYLMGKRVELLNDPAK